MPEHLGFQGRMTSSHQNNASDPVNLTLNYGYGFLEGEVRKAINSVGLEPAVGFLHDFSDYQTKQSLVYDLEEPFRWLVDLSVFHAIESKALELHDFYFTGDDYRYRFEHEPKIRFIETLREQLDSGFDFSEPSPLLERPDNRVVREAILRLTQKEARRLGIGKSTLHSLRNKARSRSSFRTYSGVRTKLLGTKEPIGA